MLRFLRRSTAMVTTFRGVTNASLTPPSVENHPNFIYDVNSKPKKSEFKMKEIEGEV